MKTYSSHPVKELNAGGFQFKDGVLSLDEPPKIAEFEALLQQYEKNDPAIRSMIKEISVDRAAEIARTFVKPTAMQGTATSESVLRAQQIAADAAKAVEASAAASTDGAVDPSVVEAAEQASAVRLVLKS